MSACFETYEEIKQALCITLNTCLNYYKANPEELDSLLNKKRNGFKINHFIDLSLDLKTIKQEYMRYGSIQGEIGTVSEKQQFHGIINMSLLAMCSNKITKLNDNNLSKSILIGAQVMMGIDKGEKTNFYVVKQEALSTLLASILVLSETSQQYKDFFCYGDYKNKNEEGFIIDLPYYGQIALHYGNNKESIVSVAKRKAESILKRKYELGQISKEDIEEIEISYDKILPQYTGKLYEYVGGFPMKDDIDAKEYFKEKCNIKPNNITKGRIKKLATYKEINDREKYFLLTKLGCSKEQLESFLLEMESIPEKSFAKHIGKKSQEEVSVSERQMVDDMIKSISKGKNKDENIH